MNNNYFGRNLSSILKLVCLIFLILIGGVNIPSLSQEVPTERVNIDSLIAELDNITNDSSLRPCFMGIKIASLSDGRTLYESNSEKLFHPASNMKLLTTAAAINLLASDFRLNTEVYTDGVIEGKTLRGNLCVKGSGDPLFTIDDLDSLVVRLNQLGIHSISGDLVGDISVFDSLYWGHGWMWDDEPAADEAFITPLSINRNAVDVYVTPGKILGDPLSYSLEAPSSYFKIINNGITSLDTVLPECEVKRIRSENILLISGRMAPNQDTTKFTLSIWKPELYFLEQFSKKLSDQNITLNGSIRVGTIIRNKELANLSHPIDSILHRANKLSDNLAAENLLKTISGQFTESSYSSTEGLKVIKDFLYQQGIDTAKMILADGSGVSMYNAISPEVVVSLLMNQYRKRDTFPRFYESLSIAGVDGTLKNRMRGTAAEGNVHAKTGTLTGTSTISGYVSDTDGVLLAFSILFNHCSNEQTGLRYIQDKILILLSNSTLK